MTEKVRQDGQESEVRRASRDQETLGWFPVMLSESEDVVGWGGREKRDGGRSQGASREKYWMGM